MTLRRTHRAGCARLLIVCTAAQTVCVLAILYLWIYRGKYNEARSGEGVSSALPRASDKKTLKDSAKRNISSTSTTLDDQRRKTCPEGSMSKNLYRKSLETAHVDCSRLFHNDKEYVKRIEKNRPKHISMRQDMSCDAIWKRILPPGMFKPLPFGVAQARIVYESYELIEDELKLSYHPQNAFCYHVDAKAPKEFRDKIENLAKCIPNVMVTSVRYSIGRTGVNMTRAYYECMKLILKRGSWGYLLLMQNYDIMIKTVYETAAILQALQGANDVHMRQIEPNRYNHSLSWDARSLKLFRDEAKATPMQVNSTLSFARGAVQATLSRAAVDWMVNTVDLTRTLDQLDLNVLGVDEVLIPTLQATDSLDMPGRFTGECVKQGRVIGFITRVDSWSYTNDRCNSKHYRHSVCVYGVEDLYWLGRYPKLIANKMMPDFDFAAIDCMHELIYNRTYLEQQDVILNLTQYEQLPNVRYHKNRQNPDSNFKLDCSYGIPTPLKV